MSEGNSTLFDIGAGKTVTNSNYGRFSEWCMEVPERIYNNRFCYMAEKKSTVYQGKQYYESYYGIYDLAKHEQVSGKEFSQPEDCTKDLWGR